MVAAMTFRTEGGLYPDALHLPVSASFRPRAVELAASLAYWRRTSGFRGSPRHRARPSWHSEWMGATPFIW
jgi:hypothetical protein